MSVWRIIPLLLLSGCLGRSALPGFSEPGGDFDSPDDDAPITDDGDSGPQPTCTTEGEACDDGSALTDNDRCGADFVCAGVRADPNARLVFTSYSESATIFANAFGVDGNGAVTLAGSAEIPWTGTDFAGMLHIGAFSTQAQGFSPIAWAGRWTPFSQLAATTYFNARTEIRDVDVLADGSTVYCATVVGDYDGGALSFSSPNDRQSPAVVVLDPAGNILTATLLPNAAATNGDVANAQCLGASISPAKDYIAVGGLYSTSVNPGLGNLADAQADPNGFIALYDGSLNPLWQYGVFSATTALVQRAAVRSNGMSYFALQFSGTTTLPTGTTATFTSRGAEDILVGAYNTDGTRAWGTGFGSTGEDVVRDLLVDNAGNTYVCGFVSGTLSRTGPGSFPANTHSGNHDGVLVKINAAGEPSWVRRVGGPNDDACTGLSFAPNGDVIVTGSSGGNASIFGLSGVGGPSAFVIFVDTDGNAFNLMQFTATGDIALRGAAIDASSNAVWLGGTYSGVLTLDNQTVPATPSNNTAFVGRVPLPSVQ